MNYYNKKVLLGWTNNNRPKEYCMHNRPDILVIDKLNKSASYKPIDHQGQEN